MNAMDTGATLPNGVIYGCKLFVALALNACRKARLFCLLSAIQPIVVDADMSER